MAMFVDHEEINLASDDESVDNFGLNESLENETEDVNEDEIVEVNEDESTELGEPSSDSLSEAPKIGMMFDTDEIAYQYYNAYAKNVGFSIRKKTMYQRYGKVQMRVLCCSREGEYSLKLTPQKRRDSKRCGCLAMFAVKKNKNDKYVLINFIEDHNHPLESSHTSHYLRSHRHIEPSQAGLIRNMSSSGIRTSDIFSYLSNEAGGSENLNFIQSDCYNFVSKTRTEFLCRGDAQCLLEYLTKKVEGNRSYFYKLRMDEDNRICSSFFSDPKSRCDYANFGDVVCFDTTYKTNNYNMICAPFVGVNHHAQTVIFGCGLLDCETTESFVWLFQTFLNAMGGKQPQTIFTDQAGAIANAIKLVFPTTHHRLCLWHIYQNAAKNLSNVFSQFQSFSKDLKNCIYEPETVDEFEECWDSLLGKYELHENAWLQNLYGLKEKWAQVYARSHFCAGMTTTQRSESINNFLKHFFAGNLILRQFVEQFDRAVADRRMKERQSDTRTRQTSPILVTEWGVEREASIKYTRKIFLLFQDELKKSFTLKCKLVNDDGTMRSYSVRDMRRESARVRTVTCMISDTFLVTCSCRKFEFHGILCAHILKFFLDELEVSSLPSQYFLPRWCVDAASRLVYDGNGYLINSDLDPLTSRRYSELMYFAQTVAAKGAITDEKSAIAKSEMVNVIAKLDSIQITDEQGRTQHDSNTPVCIDHVERRNISSGSRTLTLLDPVSKKRTGEAKGRLKSALDNRPKPKRKSKSTISESVPVVLPNQDLNFPDYSLNQMHQSQSVYPPLICILIQDIILSRFQDMYTQWPRPLCTDCITPPLQVIHFHHLPLQAIHSNHLPHPSSQRVRCCISGVTLVVFTFTLQLWTVFRWCNLGGVTLVVFTFTLQFTRKASSSCQRIPCSRKASSSCQRICSATEVYNASVVPKNL